MNRLVGAWVLSLLVGLPAYGQAKSSRAEEEAGDVSEVDKDAVGPLRERVAPVSGHLFRKKGRFEFSPGVGLSIKDAFWTKYLLGAELSFYPTETIGVGLRAAYGLTVVSGAAQICESGTGGGSRGCRAPTVTELNYKSQGNMSLTAGLDLQWAPIYGKVALVSETFLHFDMYGLLGPVVVQYLGPNGPAFAVGGHLGVGARFVLNRWAAVRVELRDLIYQEDAKPDPSLRGQVVLDLGISIFLPTTFHEG